MKGNKLEEINDAFNIQAVTSYYSSPSFLFVRCLLRYLFFLTRFLITSSLIVIYLICTIHNHVPII